MPVIWNDNAQYRLVEYENEADLESAIIQVQNSLFGNGRYYLDIKKKIGTKDSIQNIPDGYLLDLSGSKPRLYVVENELAAHDPLRHIAVEILQFSLSFEAEPLIVKKVLLQALDSAPDAKDACEAYAKQRGYRNVDHLLEHLVFESPFSALVVIDSVPENLETILSKKFRFIGENCWYAVRIHGTVRPQIKYITAYQIAPISAITYVAPVQAIEPYRDTSKYVLYFAEPAKPFGPLPLVKNGLVRAPQAPRYTTYEKLLKAKTMDDVFAATSSNSLAAAQPAG
jgi:hypothetical protein